MLDKNDLQEIQNVVQTALDSRGLDQMRGMMEEVIKDTVPQIVGDALEQVILPEIQELRDEIASIKATMVTRDFLEERLTDFRVGLADSADWVSRQLKRLTNELYQGRLLTAQQVIQIHAK
ncbi:MAG: hypothetical protein AAB865_01915 [Patescibacteria group bacterium]